MPVFDENLSVKNAPKLSEKYLDNKIFKMKKIQNISVALRTFIALICNMHKMGQWDPITIFLATIFPQIFTTEEATEETTTEKPLSAPFITIPLSSAKFLKAFHSSPERLLCVESFISSEKSSFSTRLKNTSKLACPLGGLDPDLGLKAGILLKSLVGSLQKFHLHLVLRESSSKSSLSFGSFKIF